MAQQDALADLPLVAMRAGLAVSAAVMGLLALIVLLAITSKPVVTLSGAVVSALIVGVFLWLVARGRLEFQRLHLSRVAGPGRRGPRPAFWRGSLMGVVLAFAVTLIEGLSGWLWGGEPVRGLLPGVLLGAALAVALDARDLRRWQAINGLVVFARTGAPLLMVTRGQVLRQLVVVSDAPMARQQP